MAVQAAVGYPQYSGNIITPKFSMDLIEQFYCTSLYADITTTEYNGEINNCGDQVTFFRAPRVLVREGSKDGTIKHDTFSSSPITMTIDQMLEFSVKISKVDKQQICNWAAYEAALLKSAAYEMNEIIDQRMLTSMYLDADPNNRGTTAGIRSGSYNLGVTGAPVLLDADNIIEFLHFVKAVLREQCVPMDDLFIVLPDVAEPILATSPLLQGNQAVAEFSKDSIMMGKLPTKVAGFDVYFSHNTYSVYDGGVADTAYGCVAGWRGSTAFAMTINETRTIDDKDSWDDFLQGYGVWGSKVIQAEGLAAPYVRF